MKRARQTALRLCGRSTWMTMVVTDSWMSRIIFLEYSCPNFSEMTAPQAVLHDSFHRFLYTVGG